MAADAYAPRVALITGGSNGIGKATAFVLAERGFDIGFTYYSDVDSARKLVATVEELGRRCETAYLDLGEPASAETVLKGFRAVLGRVDVLVNNAAYDYRRDVIEDTLESWERAIRVDLLGPLVAARTVARVMIADGTGGTIINVTSVVDRLPVRGGAGYCSAKAGLAAATNVLALELAEHDIRVNAVAPGFTATPQNFGPDEVDLRGGHYPEVPARRPASAREIGLAIAYLVSDDAAYVTGSRLLIDGGLVLRNGVSRLESSVTGVPEARAPSGPTHSGQP